jgi:hypothetical protein
VHCWCRLPRKRLTLRPPQPIATGQLTLGDFGEGYRFLVPTVGPRSLRRRACSAAG